MLPASEELTLRGSTARAEAWPDEQLPGGIGAAASPDPTWCVEPGPEVPAAVAETLLTVADGLVGTRGVLEEAVGSEARSAVRVSGAYDADPRVGERLTALPTWCGLGRPAPVGPGRRVLDLRDGTLIRTAVADGGRLDTIRFACVARPGTGVQVSQEHGMHPGTPLPAPGVATSDHHSALGSGVSVAIGTSVRSWSGLVVERTAVHVPGTHRAPGRAEALHRLTEATRLGPAQLLYEQRAAWAELWDGMDVETVGDPGSTLADRFALFQLVAASRRSQDVALGARGLTGGAYVGHVFWDTDAFVLPVLAAVDRRRAAGLLGYRLAHLDAARRRAAAGGHRGARFPWESAATGDDVTPTHGIDQHGDVVEISTGALEEHITADVAWAAWRYASWAGDWQPLAGFAAPLVLDGARYWVSRVRWDGRGRAHLDRVTGPDEYHEGVDDNAFTNVMARWHLRRAAELAERARARGALAAESDEWARVADALADNLDPRSLRYEQFAGYDRLEPLLAGSLGAPPLAADLILGARVARTQLIKQADVLMAHALVPEEVATGSLGPNLDHYLPRTAHGSSLSPAVHALLLARAGRPDEAVQLFDLAAAVDFEDMTQTTGGGLHLANLGGIWQALVHGFAGVALLRPDDRCLSLAPALPDRWEELRFRVTWHGRRLAFGCRADRVRVRCDQPVRIELHGTVHEVRPPGAVLP